MEDYVPSIFLGSWVLVVPYLCSRFHIFDRPILEEYVYQVEGGQNVFQSCLFYIAHFSFTLVLSFHFSLI
jgi:hypothetical protein